MARKYEKHDENLIDTETGTIVDVARETNALEAEVGRVMARSIQLASALVDKTRLASDAAAQRDEARAEVARLQKEIEWLREGEECHVARPGEGTYECNFQRPCPACRLRLAEAKNERLRDVIGKLLQSADCEWEAQNLGHDWREAVTGARAVLAEIGRVVPSPRVKRGQVVNRSKTKTANPKTGSRRRRAIANRRYNEN